MRRNSFNILLVLVTTVNAYGIVRLKQNNPDDSGEPNPKDTEGEFSYIVSLQEWTRGPNRLITMARQCIGSAITKQWVLTAGHCITAKLSHVEYGPTNSNYSRIISKHLNPGYRMHYSYGGYYAILNNNIALIKAESMELKYYGRLSARDYATILGEIVKYAGYGGIKLNNSTNQNIIPASNTSRRQIDEDEKSRIPEDLRIAEGGIIKCEQERYIIFHPAVCVAPKCGRRKQITTQGDSGGPLTLDKRIIGVNSGHSPVMSDVFTPVSPFFEWISSTINGKKKPKTDDSRKKLRVLRRGI